MDLFIFFITLLNDSTYYYYFKHEFISFYLLKCSFLLKKY